MNHTGNLSSQELRQENCHEFEASLGYTESQASLGYSVRCRLRKTWLTVFLGIKFLFRPERCVVSIRGLYPEKELFHVGGVLRKNTVWSLDICTGRHWSPFI